MKDLGFGERTRHFSWGSGRSSETGRVQTQGSFRMYLKPCLSAATKTHSNWEKNVGEMERYHFKCGFMLS